MCLWLAELIFYLPKVAGNLSEIPIHSKLSGPRLWLLRAGDVTWTAESGSFVSQTTGYIAKDDLELLILLRLSPPRPPQMLRLQSCITTGQFHALCIWRWSKSRSAVSHLLFSNRKCDLKINDTSGSHHFMHFTDRFHSSQDYLAHLS